MAKWLEQWRKRKGSEPSVEQTEKAEEQKPTDLPDTEQPPDSTGREPVLESEAQPIDEKDLPLSDDLGDVDEDLGEAGQTGETVQPKGPAVAESEPDHEPEIEPVDANEEPPAAEKGKGMFARLRAGLSRTRAGMSERITALVSGRTGITEEMFEELEEVLIQADVGVPTTLRIVEGVRERFKTTKSKNPEDLTKFVADEMRDILSVGSSALKLPDDSPKVYMVVGVNGAGKTTTIGKLASRFNSEGKRVLLGAGDTFRAAAIDQLAVWADRAGVDLIRQQEGSDPAAVAFDAVQAARSRQADVLILDTAGRLQNKVNLMRELSKVYRVIEREWGTPPDETLLVIDANTGQNGLSQAKQFMEATPLTGVVLTKLDSTSKGGIVLAIAAEIGIPVKLIGVGEATQDLRDFDGDDFVNALFPGLPS